MPGNGPAAERGLAALPTVKGLEIKTLDDPRLVEPLRILDKFCFPVKYTEKYYANLFPPKPHELSQIAYYRDILVGECCCRLEPGSEEGKYKCYIMTFCVLEAYRGLGIATRLLQAALDQAEKDKSIEVVCLHVQVGSWVSEYYQQKFGFEVKETVENYYTDISPPDALYLVKPSTPVQPAKKGKQ